MQTKRKPTLYSPELKLAATKAFLEGGMTRQEVTERYNIASTSTFRKWVIAYRREGEGAFVPKRQGRPRQTWRPATPRPSDVMLVRAEVERLKRKLGA